MARSGLNMKWTIERRHQSAVRAAMQHALGCAIRSPNAALDLFDFDDHAMVGVFYVDDGRALSDQAQHDMGVWLEFIVDDPDRVGALLVEHGCARVTDGQTAHGYFQIPGGPVFRLAKSSAA